MTGLTASAIRAVRARFGDDADAVMTLRSAHKTVRPFGDGYAVDEQPVDSAELQRMAEALNARRDAGAKRAKQKTAVGIPPSESAGTTEINGGPGSALATNPFDESCGRTERRRASEAMDGANAALSADLNAQSEMAEGVATRQAGVATGPQDTIAANCRCGRPTGHGGRCWFIRGNAGPTLKRRPAGAVKCTACGGPRSISARGDLCRKCVLAKHRKSPGQATRITALEAEVAANKAELAAFKATVKAAVADLCAHLGLGETR